MTIFIIRGDSRANFKSSMSISTSRTTRARSTKISLPPRISKYKNQRLQKYRVMCIASVTIFGAKDIHANDDTNGENRPPNWLALMVSTSEWKRKNKNARTTILWTSRRSFNYVKDSDRKTHSSFKKNVEKVNKYILINSVASYWIQI